MVDHTFVIPVYKESPYLEQCIQNLLDQTVKSKIIVTTSTPSTFTENIAATYGIPYFINDTGQKGIASDWNFALLKSDTKLVTIAHQDDIYERDYVATVTAKIKNRKNDNLLMAFTNYIDLVNDKARTTSLNAFVKSSLLLPFVFTETIQHTFLKKLILLFGDPVCCPSVTLNMDALGDFKFPVAYKCALDWYAWYELAQRDGAFMYIDKKLIQHRIHIDSETTHQLNNGIRQQEERQIFELMWGKRFAKIISKIYAIGYKDNLV